MKIAALPKNELERLSVINSYEILDTLPESDFDHLTKIASQICDTPISLITIVDQDRQWFKSRYGLSVQETPRDLAFCAHAILTPNIPFIISDSLKDDRFFDNPLVTGDPHVVFYAGIPLITQEGYPFGTLCVIDNKPKELTAVQKETLTALAQQVVKLIELRKKNIELEQAQARLTEMNEELERFAYVAAHDLKSPCNNLIMLSQLIGETYGAQLDAEGRQMIAYLGEASNKMRMLVDDILQHAKSSVNGDNKETFSFSELMDDVMGMITLPASFNLEFTPDEAPLYTSKSALLQILANLCSNAIKYNDKEAGLVSVSFFQDKQHYHFVVEDNGIGIPESQQGKVFDLFHTLGKQDRFNNTGTGIGLNTVKKLVEKLGGEVAVFSEEGKGSVFGFTIKK